MSDDEVEADKMRNALSAIANEMQRLHNDSETSTLHGKCENEELLHKLIKCKTSLNIRKIQVKKLRQNLKTACAVAKTMSSAKATETAALSSHLDFARNQYLDMVQQQCEQKEKIQHLSMENNNLRDQLENFNNVIQLGYTELQKIRDERVENISTLEQLKHIIVCCGQYYADHCNKHERCTILEQKNRFLNSRLLFMERNLEAASEGLKHLRICRKTSKENRDMIIRSRQSLDVVRSEYKLGPNQTNFTNVTMTKIELNNHPLQKKLTIRDLDLTIHLKNVKKLLDDQDNLIKDLKSLSKEINNDDSYMTLNNL